jgi:hypothetical protein
MTLREALERLSDDELEVIMQEHIDWDETKYLAHGSQIEAIAKQYWGNDPILVCDRVANETFRVYALRAAGLR